MRFGHLENLNFGMGLVAKPSQTLPAKYASLEGLGDTPNKQFLWVFLVVGALFLLLRK